MSTTVPPAVVSRDEWLRKRMALLEKEKAATRQLDEVRAERPVKLHDQYETAGGQKENCCS